MDFEENSTKDKKYVTKKMFIITIALVVFAVAVAYSIIVIFFNNKIQSVVDEMESQDSLTLIQNDDWANNIIVE